jgi:hypothetical protein
MIMPNQSPLDTHVTLSIGASILAMLLGFGLLFLVAWRKATHRHGFSFFRMLGLLGGCLLVPMPLAVGAWLTRNDDGYWFEILTLSVVAVCVSAPTLIVHIIKWVRGDARQFIK